MGLKPRAEPATNTWLNDLFSGARNRRVSEEEIREAGTLYQFASPAMVEHAAQWMAVDRELQAAGYDDEAIMRAFLGAIEEMPPGWAPSGTAVWQAFQRWPDLAFAREICALARGKRSNPVLQYLATMAVAIRGRSGDAIGKGDEASIDMLAPWSALREAIAALPPERRGPLVASKLPEPGKYVSGVVLERVLPLIDLLDGEELQGKLDRLFAHFESQGVAKEVIAQIRAGARVDHQPDNAVAYLVKKEDERTRAASIEDVARQVDGRGFIDLPGAAELASVDAWRACSDARRQAIADAVAAALDGAIESAGFVDNGAGPIAVFRHAGLGLELALVPGGSVERGLSAEEEQLVREAAEADRDNESWFEEYGQLFDGLAAMRPVASIAVGPLLACRHPLETMEPSELPGWLVDAAPFRLPSEVEWEYLARGGRSRELTWRGHRIPDDGYFGEIFDGGADIANPFGCWGFGLEPEVCADAWHGSYDGSPATAAPWWGPGDRVVRGGAAQLYPWQDCGEWHLLCSAFRTSAEVSPYAVSARPVVGIRYT